MSSRELMASISDRVAQSKAYGRGESLVHFDEKFFICKYVRGRFLRCCFRWFENFDSNLRTELILFFPFEEDNGSVFN